MTLLSMLTLVLFSLLGFVWFTPDIADWTARLLCARAAGLRAARREQKTAWTVWRVNELARRNGRG